MPITGRTRLVAIIGHPVGHSLSPVMQNAAFKSRGLDWGYIPFDVEPRHLKNTVQVLLHLGFAGFNVTIPHKTRIIPLLDRLSREARFIGAVNTVQIHKGRLIGHNTDAEGFFHSLRTEGRRSVRGRRVLVIGAGGAARAVAIRLASEGAGELVISNRSRGRGERLVRDLSKAVPRCPAAYRPLTVPSLRAVVPACHFIINATAMGMDKNRPFLLPKGVLKRSHTVYDLVYRPARTPLLQQAERAGSRAINGLGMLVHQGALAFEIWTGKKAPVKVMKEAIIDINY